VIPGHGPPGLLGPPPGLLGPLTAGDAGLLRREDRRPATTPSRRGGLLGRGDPNALAGRAVGFVWRL
jgi:hypothetical protein